MGSHHGEGGQWAQTLLIEHFCIAIWHASPLRLAFPISTKKIIALDPCIPSRLLAHLLLIKKGMFLKKITTRPNWMAKIKIPLANVTIFEESRDFAYLPSFCCVLLEYE